MRIPIRPGRSRVLAVAAGVLLFGGALAAATLPVQAATGSAGQAATTATTATAAKPAAPTPTAVTVTAPGATTEPLETPISLPLTATDTDTAGLPLTWTASGLPPGLTIAPTSADGTEAAITGTVPAAGEDPYDIKVTATDANLLAGTATLDLTMANTVTLTSPAAQASPPDTAITPLAIVASDTDADATLTYSGGGTLPTGLAIDPATGVITGTPTVPGSDPVTITATDSTGATGSAKFTWTVGQVNKIVVTAPVKETIWLGVAVNLKLKATDSAAGQTLTWTKSALPPGLTISPATGAITGRPTRLAAYTTVVTATDKTLSTGTATIKWTVAAPVVIPNPGTQTTTVGQWLNIAPFTYKDAVPGDKPAFSATGLPSGMSFQGSPMLLYGWPQAGGNYHVTLHERGSLGSTDAMTFKLVVKTVAASGASGQIHLPLAGKCLQDPGNRTASNTRVEIEGCVSGASERWAVDSDSTIRVNGRCLTVAGSGSSAGRQLVLTGCTNSTRQRWAEGNHGELVNPAAGLCVTDPGASKRNGTVPTLGGCSTRSYEQWTLPAQKVLTALGGSCLDDHFSSGVNGNVIDMFWCKYSGSQWTFEPDGTIRMFGNKCIDVRNKKAVIWTCSASNNSEKWTVARTSPMGSELAQGGVCLAIPSLTAAKGTALEPNGTQLVVSKCNQKDPRDLWHIE